MEEETKNKESLKKVSLEEVLVARLKKLDLTCTTLTSSLNSDNDQLGKLRDKIIATRNSNPEATFQDVREELVGAKELFLLMQMKEKEWERSLILIAELYELCILTNTTLDFSDEQKKNMDGLIANLQNFFDVDVEKGTVKIADHESYESKIKASKTLAMSDQQLELAFNSQFFTKK